MKTEIRHVVWDWNGTLLDDVQACVDAINKLLVERAMPEVSADQYRELFEFPVKNYYIKLGFDFDRVDWNELAEKYHAIYAETSSASPVRSGAIAILDELRARGITMTILSACKQSILDRMVSGRGIRGYFAGLHGLTNLFAQSKLALGRQLVRESRIPASQTLLVGDTIHDFEVATELGWQCVLLTGGHQSERRIRACECRIIRNLPELLACI